MKEIKTIIYPPTPIAHRMSSTSQFALALCLCVLFVLTCTAQVRLEMDGNTLNASEPPLTPNQQSEEAHAESEDENVLHLGSPEDGLTRAEHQAFAEAVDLSDFRRLAVFDSGRVKIIDTLAREYVHSIYGRSQFRDVQAKDADKPAEEQSRFYYDPVFTYLDLIFNKRYYLDKPLIHVEVLPLRQQLLSHLPEDQREKQLRQGRLSYGMMHSPQVRETLLELDSDLTMENAMNQVRLAVHRFEGRGQEVDIISPKPGDDYWIDIRTNTARPPAGESLQRSRMPGSESDATAAAPQPIETGLAENWKALADAWRDADAQRVNALLKTLSAEVPQVHPSTYPSAIRLQAEWLYNATHKFTVGWVAYLLATLALLVAFYTHRRGLGIFGVVMLAIGFAVHSAGMVVRGMLSGRWPIHNQFESFMAIAWFAVLVGLVLLIIKRQWMFGAAAAALGTCALLVANTVPIPSNEVAPVAGILSTSNILYLHVNTVLVSYALISLGFFTSLIYLAVHYLPTPQTARVAAAGVGDIATSSENASPGKSHTPGRAKLLHDLDKAQMVVLQIAFYVLAVGILLGAYWADHAWGRWWGWDPKETWALITWIVYLIAIHVRMAGGVRDRGLVTAWLSVIGFFIMLWCYWGVNLLLAGLHSYA